MEYQDSWSDFEVCEGLLLYFMVPRGADRQELLGERWMQRWFTWWDLPVLEHPRNI